MIARFPLYRPSAIGLTFTETLRLDYTSNQANYFQFALRIDQNPYYFCN